MKNNYRAGRGNPRPRVPVELQVKKDTPIGTKVKLYKDFANEGDAPLETVTRSEPWHLPHGALVVMVEGVAGGYAVDCVEVVS